MGGQNEGNSDIIGSLKKNSSSKLYQIVVYLSPKDYHRFHAPADIKILMRRAIEGGCGYVNEKALLKGKPVYEKNARVVVHGEWI